MFPSAIPHSLNDTPTKFQSDARCFVSIVSSQIISRRFKIRSVILLTGGTFFTLFKNIGKLPLHCSRMQHVCAPSKYLSGDSVLTIRSHPFDNYAQINISTASRGRLSIPYLCSFCHAISPVTLYISMLILKSKIRLCVFKYSDISRKSFPRLLKRTVSYARRRFLRNFPFVLTLNPLPSSLLRTRRKRADNNVRAI